MNKLLLLEVPMILPLETSEAKRVRKQVMSELLSCLVPSSLKNYHRMIKNRKSAWSFQSRVRRIYLKEHHMLIAHVSYLLKTDTTAWITKDLQALLKGKSRKELSLRSLQ
jgi:hypothetical protein